MSGVNSPSKEHEDLDGFENGTVGKEAGDDPAVAGQNDDEESDDYDDEEGDYEEERQIVGDEDDEEEEDEDEGGAQAKGTLTSLLLGNPNGPADGADLGDEDDEEEDDDDEEYVEDQDEPAPPVSTKKRSIDEVADEDGAQGSKKVKS